MALAGCPSCATPNPPGARFCIKCGAALVAPAPGDAATPGFAAASVAAAALPASVPAPAGKPFPWLFVGLGLGGIAILGLAVAICFALLLTNSGARGGIAVPGQPAPSQPVPQPGSQPSQPGAQPAPPAPAQPGGDPGTGRQPTTNMVPYMDPDRRFAMNYPGDWKIYRDRMNGATVFYKDSLEGTLFTMVNAMIPRLMNGEQTLAYLAEETRKKYPDFAITAKKVQQAPGGATGGPETQETIQATAAWTNAEGVKLRNQMYFLTGSSAYSGLTLLSGWMYQAPVSTWDQMLLVFQDMEQSIRFFAAAGGSGSGTPTPTK